MQMGFNNDVEYRGLTVHIQTEDLGRHQAKIMTQVFYGGAILEAKTVSYQEELDQIQDPKACVERIRLLMRALHKQAYRRLHDGAFDARLPLGKSPGAGATTEERSTLEIARSMGAEGGASPRVPNTGQAHAIPAPPVGKPFPEVAASVERSVSRESAGVASFRGTPAGQDLELGQVLRKALDAESKE